MPTSYTEDDTQLVHSRLHEWEHPISEILGSLLEVGLRLDFFREHEVLPWRRLKMMEPTGDRYFHLPEGQPRMPLAFARRKAYKPGFRSWWRIPWNDGLVGFACRGRCAAAPQKAGAPDRGSS